MTIFIPPKVSDELIEQRLQYRAEVQSMLDMKSIMDEWNKDLKQIDPYLELIKARENPGVSVTGLKPGYWHIIRHNPGAPPSITTWEGPNGEYREPDSGIFEMLRTNDLQNPEVMEAIKKKKITIERLRQERQNREDEERREELFERLAANTQVRIPFKTDQRWSQNVAGRKGIILPNGYRSEY